MKRKPDTLVFPEDKYVRKPLDSPVGWMEGIGFPLTV